MRVLRLASSRVFLASLLAAVAAFGCGDDSTSDGGDDAARDVALPRDVIRPFDRGPDLNEPTDAGDDVPDSGDDGGPWTSEWVTEPSVEIVDATPCEDWDYVPRMERGLPADSTPRVLWEFHPEEDPMYDVAKAKFETFVSQPTLSPDGTIWIQGPNRTHVSQLTRDGRMRRWYDTRARADDGIGGAIRIGPMAALPDGTLAVGTHGPRSGVLATFDPTWDVRTFMAPREDDIPLAMNDLSQIAVGPGGMVYVSAANQVTATCKAKRVMWVLTNRVDPEEEHMTGHLRMHVMPSGELLLSGDSQRLYRVDARGNVAIQEVAVPSAAPISSRNVTATVGESFIVEAFDPTEADGDTDRPFAVVVEGVLEGASFARWMKMAPSGDVWFFREDGTLLIMETPYTSPETEISYEDLPVRGFYLDDDSFLRVQAGLQRMTRNAGALQPAWTLNEDWGAPPVAGYRYLAVDETGMQYHASLQGMLAIQGDELPPPLTSCVTFQCNGHRDHWIRPAE